MTIKEALKWGISQLRKAGVDLPELDAELFLLLLAHSTIRPNGTINRAWLYAHIEKKLTSTQLRQYKKLIARRGRREPAAYILGYKEFYGLNFLVNRNVLVPRPESETLVEHAIRGIMNYESRIMDTVVADVGTGSGAIAVTLATKLPRNAGLYASLSGTPNATERSSVRGSQGATLRFFATDISCAALRVARKNARRHGVEKRIKFLRGNLLAPLSRIFLDRAKYETADAVRFVIVANLPYLTTAEWRATAPEVREWEPREALDGGKDGLKYYREMFKQLVFFTNSKSKILNPRPIQKFSDFRFIRPRRMRLGSRISNFRTTVLCEICPEQVTPFKRMVRTHFKKAASEVIKDLSGRARVVIVYL